MPFKAFYLLEAAYWLQQALVLVLQLEKPRKDFKELIVHHILTITLIWLSWRFHFSWMGLAVFITMDVRYNVIFEILQAKITGLGYSISFVYMSKLHSKPAH